MATIHEIGDNIFRITEYIKEIDLEFSHFLVNDDEPLLFHTGYRALFPALLEAAAKLIDPGKLGWISFSHFESDECGALNLWFQAAPRAQAACGLVQALVNVNDFSDRPVRVLSKEDVLVTGKRRFRFCPTPQLPHGWDAGVLFEETTKTLFCSDLFHHSGRREPLTESEIISRAREAILSMEASPLAGYVPFTRHTEGLLNGLAALQPSMLALMHGSSFRGDCQQAIKDLAALFRELLGPPDGGR